MVFSLTLFSVRNEKTLSRLWRTSIPKSKTWRQKQRKSQGTSEAQDPTLGHLAIVKLPEMFLAFSPGPVDLVPNILCCFYLPFLKKWAAAHRLSSISNVWVMHLYLIYSIPRERIYNELLCWDIYLCNTERDNLEAMYSSHEDK